jgi:hypothetical protein
LYLVVYINNILAKAWEEGRGMLKKEAGNPSNGLSDRLLGGGDPR